MKKGFSSIAMLLIALGTVVSAQSSSSQVDQTYEEQEQVRQLDKGIFLARMAPSMAGKKMLQAMVPELSEVLADNYLRIDFHGQIFTKEREIERYQETATNHATMMQIVDSQSQIFENVAVVKNTYKVENPYDYDLYPTGEYRVTNIYTKVKGKWYLSLSQWTAIVE